MSNSDDSTQPNLELDQLLSLIREDSLESIFQNVVTFAQKWMTASVAAIWWLDRNRNGFRLVTARNGSEELNQDSKFITYDIATDLGLPSAETPIVLNSEQTLKLLDYSATSCLVARIHYEDRLTGFLVVADKRTRQHWSPDNVAALKAIGGSLAEMCRNFERREKLDRLVLLLQEMSEKTSDYDLYDLVLREGKTLLACDRAVVRHVNLEDGHLTYERSNPNVSKGFSLREGEGITGLALQERRTIRVNDVTAPEWTNKYRRLWSNLPDAHSELAVPILLRKYRVRVETHDDYVDKPLGVLNFESPTKAAFSKLDQSTAEIIAQRMAPVMERIEFDRKLDKLRQAAQSLATKRTWDAIVDTLLKAIRDALGYEFVSFSIFDAESKRIRCMRVLGIDEPQATEFRKAAVHDSESEHLLAEVVRSRRTVVPARNDPRLSEISNRFSLDRLVRVFAPMTVLSRDKVIGAICAGYDRSYRPHIYWRDVQLLKTLVTFGTNAMDAWERGNIDRISHEMSTPLTGIRNHLERLRLKRKTLSDEQVELAIEDMETDTHLLYYQVQQLEYLLGDASSDEVAQPLHIEPVLLFRDIIFKTLNQLKPLVRDKGLDPRKVSYVDEDVHKIRRLYVDKVKISQVIFNLFMNAVKYAEDAETFQIRIGAEDYRDHYVIKFADWGIGVPEGLEEKIFEDRFRAPAVREVVGSGLGLTIARKLMREHGGDLILKHRHKPTEFHLIFPKQLRRRHANNVHR